MDAFIIGAITALIGVLAFYGLKREISRQVK